MTSCNNYHIRTGSCSYESIRYVIIGSDDGDLLLTRLLGKDRGEIWVKYDDFYSRKCILMCCLRICFGLEGLKWTPSSCSVVNKRTMDICSHSASFGLQLTLRVMSRGLIVRTSAFGRGSLVAGGNHDNECVNAGLWKPRPLQWVGWLREGGWWR